MSTQCVVEVGIVANSPGFAGSLPVFLAFPDSRPVYLISIESTSMPALLKYVIVYRSVYCCDFPLPIYGLQTEGHTLLLRHHFQTLSMTSGGWYIIQREVYSHAMPETGKWTGKW